MPNALSEKHVLTCAVSGDPVEVLLPYGETPPDWTLSAQTLSALVVLSKSEDREWIKVATLKTRAGDLQVVSTSDAPMDDAFEKAGYTLRHGDVYEADDLVQSKGEAQDDARISGAIARRLYTGQTARIGRTSLVRDDVQKALATLPTKD